MRSEYPSQDNPCADTGTSNNSSDLQNGHFITLSRHAGQATRAASDIRGKRGEDITLLIQDLVSTNSRNGANNYLAEKHARYGPESRGLERYHKYLS